MNWIFARSVGASLLLLFAALADLALAADWPMWRCNAQRSAATEEPLPEQLYLQWVRELPKPNRAWPGQPRLSFDACHEPVVMGRLMFVGSTWTDSVTAYQTDTGQEEWTFTTDGPVRLPPVATGGKVYFVSDDGHLYCVRAEEGTLLWKFRGGPTDHKILGNARLISTWPARCGPVIDNGTVYFAAGIWPFMGVFIHALNADSGEVVWSNEGEGWRYHKQPHNTYSFGGVAPQGALAVVGDTLLVPGGRSVPACFDRRTGKLLHYRLAAKVGSAFRRGSSQLVATEEAFFNAGGAFSLASGSWITAMDGPLPVVDKAAVYHYSPEAKRLNAYDATKLSVTDSEQRSVSRHGDPVIQRTARWNLETLWSHEAPELEIRSMIKAGSRLYACVSNKVVAIDLPPQVERPRASWEAALDGSPVRLLAANDRLFAVTQEGQLYCFGAEPTEPKTLSHPHIELASNASQETLVSEIMRAGDVSGGYGIIWGIGDGSLIEQLLLQTELDFVIVGREAEKVERLRKKLAAAGMLGRRASVHVGDPTSFSLPPYMASLMVSASADADMLWQDKKTLCRLYESLRPYGGVLCLLPAEGSPERLAELVDELGLAGAHVGKTDRFVTLARVGSLPGSADWTHEHADAANSGVCPDQLVKAPLGILWFGGPSNETILPNKGRAPVPQVIQGRLIVEGPEALRAVDIYTGRALWERRLPELGKLYNLHGKNYGASLLGSNIVSTPHVIYCIHGKHCLRLDATNGKTLSKFQLPALKGAENPPDWNYIAVVEDFLIGGAKHREGRNNFHPYCDRLWVLDRHNGKLRWTVAASHEFRNNNICLGGGRLYVIDSLSAEKLDQLRRRGENPATAAQVRVFSLADGKEIWTSDRDVFGTWLCYSEKHDVLVETGKPWTEYKHRADEADGVRAYQAANGKVLWHKESYSGPVNLHGDRILLFATRSDLGERNFACDILTGEPIQRTDPLTGKAVPWTWLRTYGCNIPHSSAHMMFFRSGAAGYYDLTSDAGTCNVGGIRVSCTNSMIPAGGVLAIPDYTRGCTCSYQNQTSLALVHRPDAEMWSRFDLNVSENIKHVALNLGAPGHRRDSIGRLWLNEIGPVATENSENQPLEKKQINLSDTEVRRLIGLLDSSKVESFDKFWRIEYDEPGYYTGHPARITGSGLAWVAASGCRGIRRLELDLKRTKPARYTVRLHFCDPDNADPGRRVFGVSLQGRSVLPDLDIAKRAGGRNRTLVEQIPGVLVRDKLVLEFRPVSPDETNRASLPLLCGIEVEEENGSNSAEPDR